MIKKIFALSVLSVTLSGCSFLDTAITSDAFSTYSAIKSGNAIEGNPMMGANSGNADADAITAASSATALGLGVLALARNTDSQLCSPIYRSLTSSKMGASVNNLLLAANEPKYAIGLGVMTALLTWRYSRNEAQSYCANHSTNIMNRLSFDF